MPFVIKRQHPAYQCPVKLKPSNVRASDTFYAAPFIQYTVYDSPVEAVERAKTGDSIFRIPEADRYSAERIVKACNALYQAGRVTQVTNME